LYTGTVMHARRSPATNVFCYRVCFYLLDVDELASLERRLRLFGYNRHALIGLRDRDYLPGRRGSVAERVRSFVVDQGRTPPDGPVLLCTNLRVLGYVFNPVSFYYLLDRDGTTRMIIAEVSNTFGDRHAYLLDAETAQHHDRLHVYSTEKHLHVSPFNAMDQRYRLLFSDPGPRLYARIDIHDDQGRPFHATLVGQRHPLTDATLTRAFLRYPLITIRIIALIHYQALRLALKRVPFHRRPAATSRPGA